MDSLIFIGSAQADPTVISGLQGKNHSSHLPRHSRGRKAPNNISLFYIYPPVYVHVFWEQFAIFFDSTPLRMHHFDIVLIKF